MVMIVNGRTAGQAESRRLRRHNHPLIADRCRLTRWPRYDAAFRNCYAWAGNQDCEATYRFDGTARILLAVKGPNMLYAVVATDDPTVRAEALATLGLDQTP
jgi:hypothetical protein